MSLKIHFLDSHLDFFPENLGEQDENLDVISTMQKRIQGQWTTRMFVDYCWTQKMDISVAKHRRKSTTFTF